MEHLLHMLQIVTSVTVKSRLGRTRQYGMELLLLLLLI